MKEGRGALAGALRATTVMVSGQIGTGFFVAPGQVLTCAHVIVGPGRNPPKRVAGRWDDTRLELEVMPGAFLPDDDLALLRVIGELDHPVACLAAPIEPGDELWAYGHPVGDYRQGDAIRLVYDGPSVNPKGLELLRVTEGLAVEGFSGGPVLSWRTGGVCGVLRRADAPLGGPPGARLIGAECIFEAFPDLPRPSLPTPDRLPWLRLLNDDQVAAGGWCYPGPRLRSYLEAARTAARTHPYRLLPDAPQLSTVYLRQQAARVVRDKEKDPDKEETEGKEDLAAKVRPVSADYVLEGGERCVFVIGGPGTGKSSLLRHMAETTAGSLLDDVGGLGVPILIPAEALAADRPLSEALAEGVTAMLGARLADRRLADMFGDEPLPGIPWIVLVDGVDEIINPDRRDRVLDTVIHWQSKPSPYRFLVTSRPLPDGKLHKQLSEDGIPLYEIEPFSQDQLPDFALRWFSALGVSDPSPLVDAFVDRLAGSRLSRLAEVPLIATMLCVVFADQDGRHLPPSRVSLYEDFITLLMEKQRTQIDALERFQQWIRPYGRAAEQGVDELLADLRPLLEHIADQRLRTRDSGTLVELAVRRAADLRPMHMPEEKWRELVEEALRLSGVVVERAGQLTFFHYTIEEYLAVCARKNSTTIVPEVIKEMDSGRSSYSLLRVGVLVRRSPTQAREVAVALSRDGLGGLIFLANLVYDGVQFPDEIVFKARDKLKAFATRNIGSSKSYDATEALTFIDPELGFRLWEQFANDNDLHQFDRVEAIHRLVRTSPRHAAVVLEPVALNWETPLSIQQTIVYELTPTDRQRSRELLTKMAMSAIIDSTASRWAVIMLSNQQNQTSQIELLEAIVNESGLPGAYRRWAAVRLFELDSLRGAAAISTVARGRTVPAPERLWAVEVLLHTNEYSPHYNEQLLEASKLFAVIALDPAAEAGCRVNAARELMNKDPQVARAALTLIAEDRYVDGFNRARAAAVLADLDLPRAVTALVTIAADPESGGDDRLQAALALAWISRPRAATALLSIAADRRVAGNQRVEAAHQLDWTDRSALPFALTIIARDPQIEGPYRTRAALRLSHLDPEPGRLVLETLVADLTVGGPDRLQAACRLAALKSDKASAALASLSVEQDLTDADRLHAALESGLHDPLVAVAADTRLDGMYRVRAAFELAAVDRSRGIDALVSLSEDPTVDDVREKLAQAEIYRVRQERIKHFHDHPSGVDTGDAPEVNLDGIPSYRVQAARLLDHYDHEAAIAHLTAMVNKSDARISKQASVALAAIVGQS